MHCLTCNYDLSNLTERRCPECGRAFDPNDPSTFYSGRRLRLSGWRVVFIVLAWSSAPLLCVLAIHLVWIAARVELGYWPRPYQPDPKGLISYEWGELLVWGLIVLSVLGFPILLFVNLLFAQRVADRKRVGVLFVGLCCLTLCVYIAAYVLQVVDPFRAIGWYFD